MLHDVLFDMAMGLTWPSMSCGIIKSSLAFITNRQLDVNDQR